MSVADVHGCFALLTKSLAMLQESSRWFLWVRGPAAALPHHPRGPVAQVLAVSFGLKQLFLQLQGELGQEPLLQKLRPTVRCSTRLLHVVDSHRVTGALILALGTPFAPANSWEYLLCLLSSI